MSPQVLGPVRPITLLGLFLVSIAAAGLTTSAAHAKECLTAPEAHTPKGGHWYYRTDRVHNRKCWYLRMADQAAQPTATAAQPDAAPTTDATPAATTPAPATPAPAKQNADSVWSAPPASPQTAVIGGATDGAQQSDPNGAQQSDPNAATAPKAEAAPEAPPNAPAGAASDSPQQSNQAADTTATPDAASRNQPARAETTAAPVEPQTTTGTKNTAVAGTAATRETSTDPAKTITPAQKALASATTPLGLLLIVALALALTGILYRILLKVFAMRGPRVIVDRSGYDWHEHRYDDAPTVPQQVNVEPAPTLVPAAAEPSAGRPRHTREEWPRDRRGSRIVPASRIDGQEERLAALMRDLDQLLQSRAGK